MLRLLKRLLGPKVCSMVPLEIWHRLLEMDLVLPYWHMVSDRNLAHVSGLYKFRSVRQFKEDIEFFLRYYTPVNLQDVIRYLDGTGRLPKRCFLPTFDDGFREMYDIVAPFLYMRGIPAIFFLNTSVVDNLELCYTQKKSLLMCALASLGDSPAVEEVSSHLTNAGITGPDIPGRILSITYCQRHVLDELAPILGCDFVAYAAKVQPYLTSEQVKDLIKKGFDIGAHSIDHPLYSELSIEQQLTQTWESLSWLSDRFQYVCQSFAFPYRDSGVSQEFFQKAFSNKCLKVSFGTGGMISHFFPKNLERFSMERTDLPAVQILGRQFGKTLLQCQLLRGRNSR